MIEDALWKAVVEFAGLYARARIDLQIMSGMLMRAEIDQAPPTDWLADLERLRELPAHKAALEELESLLKEVERARRETELRQLLFALSSKSDLVH